VWFTVNIICNSTYNDTTTCGGAGIKYIIPCADDDNDGAYGWSNYNWEYCKSGCYRGECVVPKVTCKHECNVSIDQTICAGAGGGFVYNCTTDDNGCNVWGEEPLEYCLFGCVNGICQNCTSRCVTGDVHCSDEYIFYCADIDSDGCTEWDTNNITGNVTYCSYGCTRTFNNVTNISSAICNIHSFDWIYGLRGFIDDMGVNMAALIPPSDFGPTALQMLIAFLITVIISLFIIFKSHSWQIGSIISIIMIFLFTSIGWVSWIIAVIYIFSMGILLWMSNRII